MNDRYLYRAKRTDNGEWVEGNLVWSDDADDDYKAIIIPTTDSNMFTRGGVRGDLGFENWCRVDSSTICQCTGAHDKNGKLIFENDLVRFTDEININGSRSHVSKVEWNVDVGGFVFRAYCIGFYSINPAQIKMYDVEVIGSAIENPEILEVRK